MNSTVAPIHELNPFLGINLWFISLNVLPVIGYVLLHCIGHHYNYQMTNNYYNVGA